MAKKPYTVVIEFPHDWQNGFDLPETTLEAARATAKEYARGKSGEAGYRKVTIYSLVEEVN